MSEHERPQGEREESGQRKIDLSVEVVGTPEEVWTAIATGAGVSAWMHHTEIEPRPGGRYAYDMGDGLNETGRVVAFEPPALFATEGVRWRRSWPPSGRSRPATAGPAWSGW